MCAPGKLGIRSSDLVFCHNLHLFAQLMDNLYQALNEAALLRSLRHPNITEYYCSFVSANTLHILMEFCSGGSLQQVLSRRERNEEVFDEEEVFD